MPDWQARIEGADRIAVTDPAAAETRYCKLAQNDELAVRDRLYCWRQAAYLAGIKDERPEQAKRYLEKAQKLLGETASWGELTDAARHLVKAELIQEEALIDAILGFHQTAWLGLRRARSFADQATAAAVAAATAGTIRFVE